MQQSELVVIAGGMFSRKTDYLFDQLEDERILGKTILIIKPDRGARKEGEKISSRKKLGANQEEFVSVRSLPAVTVPWDEPAPTKALLEQIQPQVFVIEEASFFDMWLVDLVAEYLDVHCLEDYKVYVVGLDMDAWRRPFVIMTILMAMADKVKKVRKAFCFVCHRRAVFTQKIAGANTRVESGNDEKYQARCRACHDLTLVPMPGD